MDVPSLSCLRNALPDLPDGRWNGQSCSFQCSRLLSSATTGLCRASSRQACCSPDGPDRAHRLQSNYVITDDIVRHLPHHSISIGISIAGRGTVLCLEPSPAILSTEYSSILAPTVTTNLRGFGLYTTTSGHPDKNSSLNPCVAVRPPTLLDLRPSCVSLRAHWLASTQNAAPRPRQRSRCLSA